MLTLLGLALTLLWILSVSGKGMKGWYRPLD